MPVMWSGSSKCTPGIMSAQNRCTHLPLSLPLDDVALNAPPLRGHSTQAASFTPAAHTSHVQDVAPGTMVAP